MEIFFAVLIVFLLVALGFAIGPLFGRPCVKGSCGGVGAGAEDSSCEFCPKRALGQESE